MVGEPPAQGGSRPPSSSSETSSCGHTRTTPVGPPGEEGATWQDRSCERPFERHELAPYPNTRSRVAAVTSEPLHPRSEPSDAAALDPRLTSARTVTGDPRRSMPGAPAAQTRPTERSLTFNLVWTGRVFDHLALFTESLIARSDARFRFVANACPPDQLEAMERFGERHPGRVTEVLEVSRDRMVRHGEALDRVLATRDDGDLFCLIDPDIIARAPFLALYLGLVAGHDAVTSGREVWSDDHVRPADHVGVNGEYFFDQDGFAFGSPHLALYRSEPLRATIDRWGIGFASAGNDISEAARARLREVGRDFWVYDTAKIVNILLQADGGSLVHVENPDLVHIGGVSHYLAPPSSVHEGPARWGEEPDWGRHEGQAVRYAVARFTAMALTDVLDGRPAPEVPDEVPDDVAARLALVRATVIDLVALHGTSGDRATSR